MATRRWSGLLGLAVVSLFAMSAPAVAAPRTWHTGGAIDGSALMGLACPSASLCVAVDAAGKALASTSPTAATSWHAVDADANNSLSGLSCPSASLCVAVDRAGNVVTSTDPTGGTAAWTAANVTGGQPLTGISCASVTICATISTSVLVSGNPNGGPGAWSDTGVGEGSYYETLHYGGPPDAPPTGISCVDAPLFCVVVNDAGGAFVSQNPIAELPTWMGTGPSTAEDLALSCTTGGLCVTTCPDGVTAGPGNCPGSDYEAGSIVAWHPLSGGSPATGGEVAPDNLTQLWCVSSRLCFATDGTAAAGLFSSGGGQGRLYVSTNPAGPSSSWSPTYTDHAGITGVACPTIGCIAVDRAGKLLVGLRPGIAARIKRALLKQLVPEGIRIPRLLRDGEYSFSFDVPAPGRLTISWQAGSRGAKSTEVGLLSQSFMKAGTRKLILKLTRQGKRALQGVQHLRVSETVSFTPRGNVSVPAKMTFTIRR